MGRWGTRTVAEAYEAELGPYTIVVLHNKRVGNWMAYCSRDAFHTSVSASTKEEVTRALELQLKKEFQKLREDFLREMGYFDLIEVTFDLEKPPRPALERLADEPI
jgi:hypothetical protein